MGALPNGFTDTLVASVESPTALAFTPDGRLLVTTQFGALRVVENGTLSPTAVVDLGPRLCTANEMGLLGVAVDPGFAANGYIYLYSSRDLGGECVNRVSRYTMSGNTIAESSELVLVDGIPATSGNHNGGDLKFGRDGYLYVSVGDAGCDYAGGGCYGQNDASRDQHALVGKILRITSSGGIPPDNPFVGAGTARCNVTGRTTAGTKCQETFAWGLRNPFRIAFDPNAAGTSFFINDVGDGAWEEVNAGLAGADYGWNVREGPCENGSQAGLRPEAGGDNGTPHTPTARRVELPRDHRRRVRPERHLAEYLRRHLPLRRLHVREDLPALAERRRLHTDGVRHGRRRGRQPRLRPGAAGTGALLHELLERRRGAADRADSRSQSAADGESHRLAQLGRGAAGRQLRRQHELEIRMRATR